MYTEKENEKLRNWQTKFETAVNEFSGIHEEMNRGRLQYEGTLQPETGKKTKSVYNFTKELIESAIDVTVPFPKVEPVKKNEKTIRLARIIEAMLVNEIKRINFDKLNDIDERNTKTTGGSIFLIEWNNNIKTFEHIGDLDLRVVDPLRFTPQPGVHDLERMDYFFLDFEDTKEKIKETYGIDVSDEDIDTERGENTSAHETVTMKWAFYKNKKGHLGIFAWAGDTIIIDDDNYQARAEEVCTKCGRARGVGETQCICGNKKFETSHLDFETLEEDIVLPDGTIIPKESYARDENGNYATRPEVFPVMGVNKDGIEVQALEQIFDDQMNVIGERPMFEAMDVPYKEPTKIPYYVPKRYPVCLRKNVSAINRVFGDSDSQMIQEMQIRSDEILTKLFNKVKHNGQILSKMKSTNFNFDNDVQVIEVDSIEELQAIRNFDLRFDTTSDLNLVNQYYYWAKSLLGINDSSQGKADPTAQSGRAKEAQIMRAQARQGSKITMKNAFYQNVYYSMFEFALAYMDEEREYPYQSPTGDDEDLIFNRYEFLELGEDGKYHYNDQFIITIDQMAGITENREAVLETMLADFTAGLYGDPSSPETILTFWKDRAKLNYPNANAQVARWEQKIKEMQEMAANQINNPEEIQEVLTEGDPGGEVDDQMQIM